VPNNWPPHYTNVYQDRQKRLRAIMENDDIAAGAIEFYRNEPVKFIEHWCITYDPRNAGTMLPTLMPFIMFPKQKELVQFLHSCLLNQESGLIEKSRDMGATWICCAFSIWLWRFVPGSSVGWGSRKETLVDKIGDPDSIFEKLRMVIFNIPRIFWPKGFAFKEHCSYMKITNPDPQSKSTIAGESGDNIGRGGRKSLFFKDEAQPLSAKVLTDEGWQEMGNLKVGNLVIGEEGEANKIILINDAGSHAVYEMHFSDGTSAECSANHLWAVDKVRGKKQSVILRTKEIVKDYIYISPAGRPQYKYRVKNCKPVNFAKKTYPLHPYVVGALLGDGTLGTVPEHCPKLTNGSAELIEKVRALIPEGCLLTPGNELEYRFVDSRGRQGYKHKSRARQAVVNAGIAGKAAHEKRIPENYLLGCVKDRWGLLQGLLDTDGSASNNGCVSYHTSSPGLADDIRFLGESLGASVTLDIKPDKRGYRDQYVLFFKFPKGVNPFTLSAKKNRFRPRSHTSDRSIVNIVKKKPQQVRCITVDSDTGLYLTNHCIVTHNSAHYEHPEKIESALGDNTNVQIDISSVKGTANVFARRREAGVIWKPKLKIKKGATRVMIMDWRDHPNKTQGWYDRRREKAKTEGLLHIFLQEVDRDYASAVEGIIIKPEWVNAVIDAHLKLGIEDDGNKIAALDVADEGRDNHALSIRKGVILTYIEEWAQGDGGEATRKTLSICNQKNVFALNYDCIGVGATVKSEINRLITDEKIKMRYHILKWNASAKVLHPNKHLGVNKDGSPDKETPKNVDFYGNLKAQGWWNLARRCEKTFEAVINGVKYPHDELIAIPSVLPNMHQVKKELSQPTLRYDGKGKIIINKTPEGNKSPNNADAVMMNYFPIPPVTHDFSALSMENKSTWKGEV
jgi:hypothetical protein